MPGVAPEARVGVEHAALHGGRHLDRPHERLTRLRRPREREGVVEIHVGDPGVERAAPAELIERPEVGVGRHHEPRLRSPGPGQLAQAGAQGADPPGIGI
jgi:hypothetical protein